MSARLIIFCDVAMEHGTCPRQYLANGVDLAAAVAAAERQGWRYLVGGRHRCPWH